MILNEMVFDTDGQPTTIGKYADSKFLLLVLLRHLA